MNVFVMPTPGVMKEGSEMVSDTVTNIHANTAWKGLRMLHILHDKVHDKAATCVDWHLGEIYYVIGRKLKRDLE